MEDIEQHGGLGGKTFFPSRENSTDIMKTVNGNTVAMCDYIFYLLFFTRGSRGCSYRTSSC